LAGRVSIIGDSAGNSKVGRPQTRPYIALRGHGKAAVEAELEKIAAEEKKIRVLRKETTAWHRAERIREYIAAARESGVKDAEWITWAEVQADRLDPLKPTPASILDDREKVIRRLRSAESFWWAEPAPEEDA